MTYTMLVSCNNNHTNNIGDNIAKLRVDTIDSSSIITVKIGDCKIQ
jgi:hypothetical protein